MTGVSQRQLPRYGGKLSKKAGALWRASVQSKTEAVFPSERSVLLLLAVLLILFLPILPVLEILLAVEFLVAAFDVLLRVFIFLVFGFFFTVFVVVFVHL